MHTMAYSTKALVFVTIFLISTKNASSFPTEHEPESNRAELRNMDRMQIVHSEQAVNPELYSLLPCQGTTPPTKNYMYNYTTIVMFNSFTHQYVCYAILINTEEIVKQGNVFRIQSLNFPAINSYPNHHLIRYKVECETGQVPVIDEIIIGLQQPVIHAGEEYCVDYVRIKPPINNLPMDYCGDKTYNGPFTLSGTNAVGVVFRTSENYNSHAGFFIRLHCASELQAEEDALVEYLQLPTKSPVDQEQNYINNNVPADSLDKLLNFASHQCMSASTLSVSSHWNIVQLALQNEESDEEEVRKAAEDVLECFPASQVAFARIAMPENYK